MAATATAVATHPIAPEQASLWSDAWRRLRRNRIALLGVIYLSFLVLVALVAVVKTPYSTVEVGAGMPYSGPSAQHLLGVDALGRDTLSRLMPGAQISLVVGDGTQLVVVVLGVPDASLLGAFLDWLGRGVPPSAPSGGGRAA